MPSAVVVDREYLKHDPGPHHPERPERIRCLLDLAEELDPGAFSLIPPRLATREEVESCHSADYIRLLESTAERSRTALDGDTLTSRESFGVALLATGGFLRLLDAIAAGECASGFALVRPPGHHALADRAMGFCLLNTIAIGARCLRQRHGAQRVLILDWDVHHGNGTQEIFYDDPSVLYASLHQYPYYPGTGAAEEVGEGPGEGFTVNVPLPAGCADADYLAIFREVILPIAEQFAPDWVLVSAGFDPHARDPLGGMEVTETGFAAMASSLIQLANKHAQGRIAFLLEGGYDLRALRASAAAVLGQMERAEAFDLPGWHGSLLRERLIRRVREIQAKYWSL